MFFENRVFYKIIRKIIIEPDRPQMKIWHLHFAEYLRLQTQTHSIEYLLLFHYNNCCKNAPECDVTRTLPVLFRSDLVLTKQHHLGSQLRDTTLNFIRSYLFELSRTTEMDSVGICHKKIIRLRPS